MEEINRCLTVHNPIFFLGARAGGILRMLQSDWFRERAEFSDLAHGQRNPGVMSLLCFRGCESLSKKPINAMKISEINKLLFNI